MGCSAGGLIPPPPGAEIWGAQSAGFTRTTLKYHSKYSQFWLIILAARDIKISDKPRFILEDHKRLQNLLDNALDSIPNATDRAYDMRHAFLYLTYPDRYERIISTGDKKKIVETYQNRVTKPLSTDLDEALLQIREVLSSQYKPEDHVFDFYSDVRKEWKDIPKTEKETTIVESTRVRETVSREIYIDEDSDLLHCLDILQHTKNLILYGPPGTGKTYIAGKTAEALIRPQLDQGPAEAINIMRAIEGLTFYDVLAMSMYLENGEQSYTVTELENQRLVVARFSLSPVKNPKNNIWGYLQAHTDPDSTTVKTTRRSAPYLFDKDDTGRWFLTNEGREYVRENLYEKLKNLQPGEVTQMKPEDFIRWSTFHQSYAYEDFVEGLRPITSEEDPGSISYEIVPGIFRRICSRASRDPHNSYVLIIDEINRGNIAKILGELITLIEDDKRSSLLVELPYSGELFTVPENLYIIGTMNTADRSIALLDVALRRRFAFQEIMPRPELLADEIIVFEETPIEFDALLRSINASIMRHIDRDHQIGHSYFMKVLQADEDTRQKVLEFVWNNQIIPLLEEYFFSQREKLAEVLEPFITDVEMDAEEEILASVPVGRVTGEDLVYALSALVKRSS